MSDTYTFDVTDFGYFALDDCHADVNAIPLNNHLGVLTDFPPTGMEPLEMGFFTSYGSTSNALILDQTVLLQTGPGYALAIDTDNNRYFDTFDDFVYQDQTRTFYAAVTNSLERGSGLEGGNTISLGTLERVRRAYYLPASDQTLPEAAPTQIRIQTPAMRALGPPDAIAVQAPGAVTTASSGGAPATARDGSTSTAPVKVPITILPGVFGDGLRHIAVPQEVFLPAVTASSQADVDPSVTTSSRNGLIDYLYWTFHELYHPYVCMLLGDLYVGGPAALFNRQVEINTTFDYFAAQYQPTQQILLPYPMDDITFDQSNGYAIYNWEIFFHIPLLIAKRLMLNQKFEDAQKWFHYIFNPTDGSSDTVPRKYWVTRPFYEHTAWDYYNQRIERLLQLISQNSPDPELQNQIRQWRDNPFDPHLIARLRTVAFQKTTVMKYLDDLIAWGDMLFTQDTIETINEATQMYILAAKILGPRQDVVTPRATMGAETYDSLEPHLDDFSNALVAVENLVPPIQGALPIPKPKPPPPMPHLLYFCCPKNDKLLGYWDTVADRLFKIRHSLNIQGVFQQLPLFEPPIDPALLVAATAAGIDLGSALGDLSAPPPLYRFNVLLEKANAFCAEVKSLGAQLLAALEKSDAEQVALLRSGNEIALLQAMRDVKNSQVAEATQAIDSLSKSQAVIQLREIYYAGLPKFLDGENQQLTAFATVASKQGLQSDMANIGAVLGYVMPDFKIGVPTTCGATWGSSNLLAAFSAARESTGHDAAQIQTGGSSAATLASYQRRNTEYAYQVNLANAEIEQIKSQILAANVRLSIAQKEVANHELQISNAQSVDDLMHSKFTNQELYDWMVAQVSSTYFQAYQLAYDVAKRAEAAYRFELGITDANYFISFGYWDSLRDGLLAGERLGHAIRQLELAYLENHRRQYEITKNVSLLLLAPRQLVNLHETGKCMIDLPEWLFDLDYPGHYMRRIKSVSVTIPCVSGPYTSVNCTLTLAASSVRLNTQGGGYPRTLPDDGRFKDNFVSVQSIATSTGLNDSGMFELNFRDERYLPFEGAGAISTWMLEMPPDRNAFDFETISDVVLRLNYTARDGGSDFAAKAAAAVAGPSPAPPPPNFVRLLSAAKDFPDAWYLFRHPSDPSATTFSLQLTIGPERFPFLYRDRISGISELTLVVRPVGKPDSVSGDFDFTAPDGSTGVLTLHPPDPGPDPQGASYALPFRDLNVGATKPFGVWTFVTNIDVSTIADVMVLFKCDVKPQ
jgi:hypothetical protein